MTYRFRIRAMVPRCAEEFPATFSRMHRRMVLVVAMVLSIHTSWTSLFQWGFEVKATLKSGSIMELVYDNNHKISQLEWRQQLVPHICLALPLRIWNFVINSQLSTAIPMQSGKMEDYDFLASGGAVSHYSRHSLYVDKDLSVCTTLGYRIPLGRSCVLIPMAGIAWYNRKFTAQDGFLQYPAMTGDTWRGDEPRQPLSGSVISYEQSIWHPLISMTFMARANRGRFGLTLDFSPYIAADTLDSHILRLQQFYDTMRGGIGWGMECWIEVMPFKRRPNLAIKFAWPMKCLLSEEVPPQTSSV